MGYDFAAINERICPMNAHCIDGRTVFEDHHRSFMDYLVRQAYITVSLIDRSHDARHTMPAGTGIGTTAFATK